MDPIEEVKSKTDIIALISEYLPLKKAGRNLKALCPFHQEKTPSFMVSPELQIWHCFGCGLGGDVFGFLKQMENLEFGEALRLLAERAGVQLPRYQPETQSDKKKRLKELNHLAAEFYHYLLLKHAVGETARVYLRGRKVEERMWKKFFLGYAPAAWRNLSLFLKKKGYAEKEMEEAGLLTRTEEGAVFDKYRSRLMFPVCDLRGEVVGFSGRILKEGEPKYLNSPETLIFHKGSLLYGLNLARGSLKKEDASILVEGNMDVVLSHQVGVENVVATLGSSATEEHLKILRRFSENLVLSFDADSAGLTAIRRSLPALTPFGFNVRLIVLPSGMKDPADCVEKDPVLWQAAVKKSVSVYDFFFEKLLGNLDPKDALNKKKVGRELLSLITNLTDPIEKGHYLARLARSFGVELKDVREALLKLEQNKSESGSVHEAVIVEGEKLGVEEYVLALLLRLPSSEAKEALETIGEDSFQGEQSGRLFALIREELTGGRDFKIEALRARLPADLSELFRKVALFPWVEIKTETMGRELRLAAAKLQTEARRGKMKSLSYQMERAEEEGDEARLRSLRGEFKNLSEFIRHEGKEEPDRNKN